MFVGSKPLFKSGQPGGRGRDSVQSRRFGKPTARIEVRREHKSTARRISHLTVDGASSAGGQRKMTDWMTLVGSVRTWWYRARLVSEPTTTVLAPERTPPRVPAEYLLLYTYLENRYAADVVLTFEQMETLLGFALPASACTDPDWWTAAAIPTRCHSAAWTVAGRTATSPGPDRHVCAAGVTGAVNRVSADGRDVASRTRSSGPWGVRRSAAARSRASAHADVLGARPLRPLAHGKCDSLAFPPILKRRADASRLMEEILSPFGGRNEAEAFVGNAFDRAVRSCHR